MGCYLMISRLKILGVLLVALLILWFAGFVCFSQDVFKYIGQVPQQEGLKQPVGIAVLTGGRYRIAKGMELLNGGYGERLIISGVIKGVTLHDIAAKENIEIYDDMPLHLGYEATTTVGNAKEIGAWAKQYGIKTIIAVTSFYHIPRSRSELKHEMPDVDIYFAAVSSGYVRRHWWKHWGSFKFLAVEYCKYLAVKLQYLAD